MIFENQVCRYAVKKQKYVLLQDLSLAPQVLCPDLLRCMAVMCRLPDVVHHAIKFPLAVDLLLPAQALEQAFSGLLHFDAIALGF